MRFWFVTLIHSQTGERNLNDPSWVAVTFGGDSVAEVNRQIQDAKESVMIANSGPPKQHLIEEGQELFVEIIEFSDMGIARLP